MSDIHTHDVDVIESNQFNKTTNMLASEGPHETVELPPLEWAEDTEFDEDDEFDELRQKSSTTHRTVKTDSNPLETVKSPTSHRPEENKTAHSKASHQPLYGYPTANFKRDPAIDVIIDSRKSTLIDNAYTRLAQTTSQRIRSSQQVRLNSLKVPPVPTEVNHEAPFVDRSAHSQSSKRTPLAPIPQFENDTYDDGLGIEFDKESIASVDKSSVQVYEETCKRLNICPCSTIIRSLYTTHINLANYGLGPRGCAALAVALVRNTTVVSLDLTGNNIGNSGMSHIYQILTENAFVEEYNLSFNKLGTKGIRKLAIASPLCLHVNSLNIAGNELCATDLNIFLSKYEDHPNLKELNISHNLLDEEGGIYLAKWLSDNNVLQQLDASWCSIRLAGARAMAKAIGDNNKLLSLNISNNSFTNETVDVLIDSLTRNLILVELDLEGNHISCRYDTRIRHDPSILLIGKEAVCYRLLVAAATNQSLKRLRIGKNHLDARCIKLMLEALAKLENISLEELDLTGSSFSSKDLLDIHRFFADHPKLTCYLGPVRQTVEKFANNLLNSIHRHFRENHLTVNDLFPNENDSMTPLTTVTYDQFRHGLRKAKIPFPSAQIEEIMKYLGTNSEPGAIPLRMLEVN